MKTSKAIERRRSIRKYKNIDVSPEMIMEILEAGRQAPSPKNKQPWRFVVTNGTVKDRVANLMIAYALGMDLEAYRQQVGYPSSIGPTADIMKQAPVVVLVFREPDPEWEGGDNLAIGACIENMCLRATELGLGTLWCRDVYRTRKEIAETVGHPEWELNSALVIGHADEEPVARSRHSLEDLTEWQWEEY